MDELLKIAYINLAATLFCGGSVFVLFLFACWVRHLPSRGAADKPEENYWTHTWPRDYRE